ncbi:MAG: hypothetical protein DRQ55_09705 [Planctomycetota bacterium]|nr:MAG: hypothetical protein DRQ55_09705 [Planctomycetota bacterium]
MTTGERSHRGEIDAFLSLLFGDLINDAGRFTVGQLPIWNRATRRTTWCETHDQAIEALASASDAGEDAYFPVALHDPTMALAAAQQRKQREAKHDGGSSKVLTQAYVRGGVGSAVAIVGFWLDEDHAGGDHKRGNLPDDLATVLQYLNKVPHPLAPSLALDTGGGAHAWLLLREPFLIESDDDRNRAASLARRYQTLVRDHVAPQYAHDTTGDLSRVLRVPGTVNSKYGTHTAVVHLDTGVQIGVPESVHRIDVSEVEDELDLHAVRDDAPRAKRSTAPSSAISIGTALDRAVQGLVDGNAGVRNLFLGKGKPELGRDGRTLDTTSSGYDFSLAMALARKGVEDRSAVATAIWLRSDGAAAAKGIRYVEATVDRAFERVAAIADERAEMAQAMLDFQVDRVRIFDCDPAMYELMVSGTALRFTTSQLLSKGQFVRIYTDAMKRIPGVPKEPKDWSPIVNEWLEGAERIAMPPEASDELALREAIQHTIDDLPVSDEAEELDRGKAVALEDGRRLFKADTLLSVLSEAFPRLTRSQLCRVLNDLGHSSETHRIDGEPVRAWASNPPVTREGES